MRLQSYAERTASSNRESRLRLNNRNRRLRSKRKRRTIRNRISITIPITAYSIGILLDGSSENCGGEGVAKIKRGKGNRGGKTKGKAGNRAWEGSGGGKGVLTV